MSNCNFYEDLSFENNCYKYILKPFLAKKGYDTVFIHSDNNKSDTYFFNIIQKKKDIDCIVDIGNANYSISFKSVRYLYENIFFETIKNTNTQEKGWGFYSKADYIFYLMTNNQCQKFMKWMKNDNVLWKLYIFDRIKILNNIDLDQYPIGAGLTKNNQGDILYHTIGRLIPINIIKNIGCSFYENDKHPNF